MHIGALPDSILGQVKYVSTWNADTNTPELPAANSIWGTGEKYEGLPVDSCFFIVEVESVYEGVDYNAGDWIISDGAVWKKVDNSDAVTTVFGRLGNIVANETDYEAFYPKISSSYSDPDWISSLTLSKITGLSDALADKVSTTATYTDPNWITSLAFSKITGVPDFALTSALSAYEPTFTKNQAFNKNFGTTAGTVLEGSKDDTYLKKTDAEAVALKDDTSRVIMIGKEFDE
ncbi:hypothetical protein, partial [Leeuwenhoekiella blandensis]|uniref:hypothetical protein n=1 Tax=Leeuwenhoekiella blandensis TaxID=360293 RepID=UPI002355AB23